MACGQAAPAATAADAVVKPADLPAGMVKCPGSGGVGTFLDSIKTTDPVTYRLTNEAWNAAKQDTALAGEIVLYTDSTAGCDSIHGQPSGQIASAGSQLVMSGAMQYPDEASAQQAYARDSIMGWSAADMQNATGSLQGNATGLGPNSVVVSASLLAVYAAVWQYKTFLMFLITARLDVDKGQKAAASVQARLSKLNVSSSKASARPKPMVTSGSGKVGQAIALDTATVTVVSADLNASPLTSQPTPAAGHKVIKVSIDVVYKRTERSRFDWTLTDASGAKYQSDAYDLSLPNFPTQPGDDAHADVWFDVPTGAVGLSLIVTVGVDRATISLE
jgi:hypothetical protein